MWIITSKQSLETSRNTIGGDSLNWVLWAKWKQRDWNDSCFTGAVTSPAWPSWPVSQRQRVSLDWSKLLGGGVVCCIPLQTAPTTLPKGSAELSHPLPQLERSELLPVLLAWAQTLWPKAASLSQQLPFQRPNITIPFPAHKSSSQTAVHSVSQPKPVSPSPQPKITAPWLVWAGIFFFPVFGTLFRVIFCFGFGFCFVLLLPFESKQSNWRSCYINIPH